MWPSAVPLRFTSPMNCENRSIAASAGVPAADTVARVSPCAIRLMVPFRSPERCSSILSALARTPTFMP